MGKFKNIISQEDNPKYYIKISFVDEQDFEID